jgi:small GTP-binding protein
MNESGIKVILLGESFVGKTSLINISTGEKFSNTENTTFNANYRPRKFKYKEEQYIFNLWDTIGQEKYRSLTKMFFNDSQIVILVYDISVKKTFEQLNFWYDQVVESLGKNKFMLAIVGNKKDLFKEEQVKEEEGKKFAEEKNAKFILSSAKSDPLSFNQFLDSIFGEYIENNKDLLDKQKGIGLNNKKGKKKKCCK